MPPQSENYRIEQLCVLAQANDTLAERQLFLILTDSFRIFAQHKVRDSAEVEDIVQDALAVVAQKYKETTFVSSFAGWAHNVLRNTLLSHYREKAIHSRLQPEVLASMDRRADPTEDLEFQRKVVHCVERVAKQNRRFARALNLRYQGFTVEETAAKLEIKTDYLYVILTRARSMLEACLGLSSSEIP